MNDIWQDVKKIWKNSSKTKKIDFQVTELIAEFESKVSQFEKDLIYKDINTISSSISQFERKSIERDLEMITSSVSKLIKYFKRFLK